MIRDAETGHAILFIEVPDTKTGKNRIHFDLRPRAGTRDDEIERVRGLGATEVGRPPRAVRPRHRLGRARRPRGQRVLHPPLGGRGWQRPPPPAE